MKLEFQKLELFEKIYFKFAENFFMVLGFMELEYYEKLDFAKLKYPKNGKSLHIFKIIVDYNIVCRKYFQDVICAIFAVEYTKQNHPGHHLPSPTGS